MPKPVRRRPAPPPEPPTPIGRLTLAGVSTHRLVFTLPAGPRIEALVVGGPTNQDNAQARDAVLEAARAAGW